ncbi:MAG: replication-associated recombination protein A [Chitinophagales bacterium]
MSLFQPLAERMRPKTLDEFVGQEHLVGKDKVLRKVLESGHCPSMIFWGPPGVGKTTMAMLIANYLDVPFYTLSAISSGVKQVREVIAKARLKGGRAILFIDEIHRFSKSQQDSLLGAVEKGTITLIGATTENPSFEVIAALLSRSQVYVLEELGKEDLLKILQQAMETDSTLQKREIELQEYEALLQLSGGDARRLLNLFELLLQSIQTPKALITNQVVEHFAHNQMLRYDKGGEQHYDIISAFIKSMRGSDPNAAVYWLARMLEGGEDPKFIARRLLILASEDIGNANPNALLLANACFEAVAKIGYPECGLILSQTAIYLATSAKSNASYKALKLAQAKAKQTGNLPVPLPLRNAPTKLMKELNYGKNYQYSHDYEGNFAAQEFLPDAIKDTKFYEPGNNAREQQMRKQLREWWGKKYGY